MGSPSTLKPENRMVVSDAGSDGPPKASSSGKFFGLVLRELPVQDAKQEASSASGTSLNSKPAEGKRLRLWLGLFSTNTYGGPHN